MGSLSRGRSGPPSLYQGCWGSPGTSEGGRSPFLTSHAPQPPASSLEQLQPDGWSGPGSKSSSSVSNDPAGHGSYQPVHLTPGNQGPAQTEAMQRMERRSRTEETERNETNWHLRPVSAGRDTHRGLAQTSKQPWEVTAAVTPVL